MFYKIFQIVAVLAIMIAFTCNMSKSHSKSSSVAPAPQAEPAVAPAEAPEPVVVPKWTITHVLGLRDQTMGLTPKISILRDPVTGLEYIIVEDSKGVAITLRTN
jgi:hypothetical protein